MFIEFFEEGAAESDEDQRDDNDGEDGVGEEQGEVDRANQTLSLEGDVADAVVVDEIGNEEGAGDGERGEHEFFVELDFAVADGGVATGEENGAGTVEGGVEGGVGEQVGATVLWLREDIRYQGSDIRKRRESYRRYGELGGRRGIPRSADSARNDGAKKGEGKRREKERTRGPRTERRNPPFACLR